MTKEEWLRKTTRIIADNNGNILSFTQGELAKPMTIEQAKELVIRRHASTSKTPHVVGILLICTYFIWMMVL